MDILEEERKFKGVILYIVDVIYQIMNDLYQDNIIDNNPIHLMILKDLLVEVNNDLFMKHMIKMNMFWIGLLNCDEKNIEHIIESYNIYSPVNLKFLMIPFQYIDKTDMIDDYDLSKIWKYIHTLIKIITRYICIMRNEDEELYKEVNVEFFIEKLEIDI